MILLNVCFVSSLFRSKDVRTNMNYVMLTKVMLIKACLRTSSRYAETLRARFACRYSTLRQMPR